MNEEDECPFCGAFPGEGCLLEDDCIDDEQPPCVELEDREARADEAYEARRDRETDR